MAEDKNIAITVQIDGVEKSITTVKDLKDSIKKLQEQAESSDFGSESYKNAVEELDRLNSSLKSVTQTEEQYAKSLQDIVKAEKEAIVESQDLRKQFEKLENELFLMAGQGKQNTKEFRALTVEAANLNKKIDAVNGSLGENSAGRAAAGFSQLKDGLVNLDFDSVKKGLTAMKTALASTGIMLIVMAVSYLITNFEELSKGTGLLGVVLRAVGAYIGTFIDALTWFTDKIGLTTSELDAMRESMVANAEKAKEALGEQTKEYDRLIAVAKSNGESTVQIELDKQRAIQATNEMILRQMLAQVKSGVELDEAQKKLLTSTLASVKDTHTAITVIENTDRKDKAEKDNKAYEDNKAANIAMIKQIEDAKITAIKDDEQRAFAKETLDNQRRVKAIQADKANSDLKNQMLLANEQLFQDNLNAINLTAKAKKDAIDAKVISDKAIADKKILDDAKIALDNKNKDAITGAQLKVAQDANDMNAKIALLTAQKDIELQNANLTANEKLLINQKYENDVTALKKTEVEKQAADEKQARDNNFAAAQSALTSLQSLSDAFFEFKRSGLQKGSAEELAAAKKQFNINKGIAIASATISGIQGVINALTAQSVIPEPFGTILKAATAVGVGAAAAVNIAKISKSKFDAGGGGGGGDVASTGMPSIPIPSPPTLNTPGANTNSGTTFDSTGKNTSATTPTINVNATIGVDEINSKQNRVSVLEKQSTF